MRRRAHHTNAIAVAATLTRPVGRAQALVRFFRDSEASLAGKMFTLMTVAYVLWPLDLVPDVAPVVGFLDDFGLAAIAMTYLARVTRRYQDAIPAARP